MAKAAGTILDQLPLTEMKRGLVKPIATVQWEPQDFSKKLGISFQVTQDDLDEVQAALIRATSRREFALVRHRDQPDRGTDILTAEDSEDLSRDLREALQVLRISLDDLIWIHPRIESATKAVLHRGWNFLKKHPEPATPMQQAETPARSGDDPGKSTPDYKKFMADRFGKDVLSTDVEVRGTIKFQKELQIDGKVEGEISSRGILTVGESADIRADIKTKSITVYGKIQGNITASERCELKSKCTLQGDLKAARLIVEEGATFIGNANFPSGA